MNKGKSLALSFNYCSGNRINSGFQALIKVLRKSDFSGGEYGYGVGLNYYDIKNTTLYVDGYFLSLEIPIFINYYFLSKPEELFDFFIGTSFRIKSGTEKIKNYPKDENNFYFGVVLEQYVGISLFKTISFEAGVFELAFLGSELLPSDTGYKFGINIHF